MAIHNIYLASLCLTWLMCISNAEVVHHHNCDPNPGACDVTEVRVTPCPESEENKPCKVKRGKSATIEFEYKTQWEATELHGQVYSVTDDGDLPLIGMNTVGCEFTTCPVQSGIKQTYNYTLPLARKFPVGTYTIKWVVRNKDKPENTPEQCCFTTRIKLTK